MRPIDEQLDECKKGLADGLAAKYPSLQGQESDNWLQGHLGEWEQSVKEAWKTEFPFKEQRDRLLRAELDLKMNGASKSRIEADLMQLAGDYPGFDAFFWKKKCEEIAKRQREKTKTDNTFSGAGEPPVSEDNSALADQHPASTPEFEVLRRNEQEAWRKEYERMEREWQLDVIRKKKDELQKELEERFEKMRQLQEVFDELGLEQGGVWNTSVANLCKQDIDTLRKWAKFLKENKNIRELCELMGRLRKAQQSHKRELIEATTHYTSPVPDIDSKEEIIGVELGNDLERMLPQELALLGTPETSILFDLKFAEKRLMCFAMQGYQDCQFERTITKEVEVEAQEKMGPIILCVDTSGSMAGTPENIAKAITLSLASTAATQKRACYLINFSTSITTLDFSPPKGIEDLVVFLSMSFGGETDVEPALSHGVKMMNTESFKNADLLVISDFLMDELPGNVTQAIARQKTDGNKFHALVIGAFPKEDHSGPFDQKWTYNPRTGRIAEISNAMRVVSDRRRK